MGNLTPPDCSTVTDVKLAQFKRTEALNYLTQTHDQRNNDTKTVLHDTLTRVSCLRAKESMFPGLRPEEEAAQPGNTRLTGSERAV